MNARARGLGAAAPSGGAERSRRRGGTKAATPDNLIHRNNCSNPALARVTARLDFPEGVPFGVVFDALRLPFPVAVEVLRRAGHASKSTRR